MFFNPREARPQNRLNRAVPYVMMGLLIAAGAWLNYPWALRIGLGWVAGVLWMILLRTFLAAMMDLVVVAPAPIIAFPWQMARGRPQN